MQPIPLIHWYFSFGIIVPINLSRRARCAIYMLTGANCPIVTATFFQIRPASVWKWDGRKSSICNKPSHQIMMNFSAPTTNVSLPRQYFATTLLENLSLPTCIMQIVRISATCSKLTAVQWLRRLSVSVICNAKQKSGLEFFTGFWWSCFVSIF